MILTSDHHLRRIGVTATERFNVALLPVREFPTRERILPTDVIPIGHMEFQRDDILALGQIVKKCFRGRA